MKLSSVLFLASALSCASGIAATITFEDVPLGGTNGEDGVWSGQNGAADITRGGATFNNNEYGGYYSGFVFSNHTDTSTNSYSNQFSAYPGSGAGGSTTYAIGNFSEYEYTQEPRIDSSIITFASPTNLAGLGMSVANTTWTALAILNGSGPATAFTTGDWFLLRVTGFLGETQTGTFDFYLADYRGASSFLLADWASVDLTGLGTVDTISFTFDSSDVGGFGINTPTYFAMDNFLAAVPEPSSCLISCLGLALMARRKR